MALEGRSHQLSRDQKEPRRRYEDSRPFDAESGAIRVNNARIRLQPNT